ncbi:MAG TPA: NUDIX hydrolase [Candidatus Gallacutalibacter pullistercoris]|nr:NUDIX hydrolase [Candidatus Gallacutalibacter pullistercoris]
MADILFKMNGGMFSYRVAGVCVQNGKVLLQKPSNDDGYAFPGGHVAFGETNAETLRREFKEEIYADITVGELKWVGEIFFPWGEQPCHQICLYYQVEIQNDSIPMDGMFLAKEQLEGRNFILEFHWIPIAQLKKIKIYPENAYEFLSVSSNHVQHFVYRQE